MSFNFTCRMEQVKGKQQKCTTRNLNAKRADRRRHATRGRADEDLLVLVLEGEVQSLRGEIADDVGGVATPECRKSLILVHTAMAQTDGTYQQLLSSPMYECVCMPRNPKCK